MTKKYKENPTLSEFNEDIDGALSNTDELKSFLSTLKAVNMDSASQNDLVIGYTLATKAMQEFAEDDERLPQLQNIAEDCHNKWKNTLTVLDYKRKSNENSFWENHKPAEASIINIQPQERGYDEQKKQKPTMSFVDRSTSRNCFGKGRGR